MGSGVEKALHRHHLNSKPVIVSCLNETCSLRIKGHNVVKDGAVIGFWIVSEWAESVEHHDVMDEDGRMSP